MAYPIDIFSLSPTRAYTAKDKMDLWLVTDMICTASIPFPKKIVAPAALMPCFGHLFVGQVFLLRSDISFCNFFSPTLFAIEKAVLDSALDSFFQIHSTRLGKEDLQVFLVLQLHSSAYHLHPGFLVCQQVNKRSSIQCPAQTLSWKFLCSIPYFFQFSAV